MEERWLARDDSPYPRDSDSSRSSRWGWALALLVTLIGGAAGIYYFWPPAAPVPQAPAPAPVAEKPTPAAPAEPAIRHPLEAPAAQVVQGLPSLDNSDSMMRDALSGLLGAKPFETFVYPTSLVRRIVATVDNLPRASAPTRVLPWQPVPGAFATAGQGEQIVIDTRNTARYEPYVRVAQRIDSRALVRRYIDSYPLFQRAYEELGYPGRYFNDRLVEAIDDLLESPELPAPAKLAQPKVLYEFADPELQHRSAGQKLMMRIGRDNETKLKDKLREIRAELGAAGAPR